MSFRHSGDTCSLREASNALKLLARCAECSNALNMRSVFGERDARLEADRKSDAPADILTVPSRKSAAPCHVAWRFGLCTVEAKMDTKIIRAKGVQKASQTCCAQLRHLREWTLEPGDLKHNR